MLVGDLRRTPVADRILVPGAWGAGICGGEEKVQNKSDREFGKREYLDIYGFGARRGVEKVLHSLHSENLGFGKEGGGGNVRVAGLGSGGVSG